jgi:hypothetical protein
MRADDYPRKKGRPIVLTVMNPRGAVAPPPKVAAASRPGDLAGKRIGLYWNGKAGADKFLDVVEAFLKERLPASTVLRFEGPLDVGDSGAAALAEEADTFVYGIGD